MDKIKVIAVVGPTASGKTSLGIEIAKKINGEIVSADSMQIYKGMEIATAKPTQQERTQIPHHLIDFLEPAETYSVAEYVRDAKNAIEDIVFREKNPVIVGGTGLYTDSLLEGIEFGFVPNNETVRTRLKERMEKEGSAALLSELRNIDPETASKLSENNKGRIIRALEVYYLTGETISEQKRKSREKESPYDAFYIGIEYKDRQNLYRRIEKRADMMIEDGLLEEAEKYINLGEQTTAKQAIGYKELKPYFEGKITLDEAVSELKKQTRHYAKRQMTWFRRNKNIFYVYPDEDEDYVSRAVKAAEEFLRR
ncbi:MAG: tRNA (adenosine(37)-N6)-dimethylallyltransferase MiaA [Clostridiales bacterium]|nr:tRNA (adenosine(37)-N6)-dimethylallyltransferase MiaA [Clostridiales bacterium]